MNKKELGQFYTTNYEKILSDIEIPPNITQVIEPFAGNGDLKKYIEVNKNITTEYYDIDPKKEYIIKRDTLLNPPDYKNKFIITNPPYLSRNKSKKKEIYDKYKCNDLYKCFIKSCLDCMGGILIIPINFISSIRKSDKELRRLFFSIFSIRKINIFQEKVFDETSCNVISFLFTRKDNVSPVIEFNENNDYCVGGEIYKLKGNKHKIQRATKKNIKHITNINLKCIDDKEKLKLYYSENHIIDNTKNLSNRSYCTLLIEPEISIEDQKILIDKFNNFINSKRLKYNSLFLTNYRDNHRKRISFNLVFNLCSYLLID